MTTSASASFPREEGTMRRAHPATPVCPLRPRGDLTVGIVAAETAAGPSFQGVEPPG